MQIKSMHKKDHVGNAVLPRMAAALIPVHGHGVAADGFGLQRMPPWMMGCRMPNKWVMRVFMVEPSNRR
jgi:hypothetical protein